MGPGLRMEPYFAEEAAGTGTASEMVNVTAQIGITTYLHCKVNSLGGKTVSSQTFFSKTNGALIKPAEFSENNACRL